MEIGVGTVIGDYEVIGVVGHGGMGEVFKVRNVISERIDAMKILRTGSDNPKDAAERFLREIKLQASLKHPNIALLHTAMRLDDQILMFMELVEGVGLDQRLRRGPVAPSEAVKYASQCLRALEYAHLRGVVHRDIKPSNIIVMPAGVVKLVDFGIARGTADIRLTGTGMAVGSAHYMSPEQALGQEVDARSDLYSVGVTLYEMLTGARPFTGENAYSVLKAHLEQEPLSPDEINPGITAQLAAAVIRALAKSKTARFPTAVVFREAIESGEPGSTLPLDLPIPPPPESMATMTLHTVDPSTTQRLANLLAGHVGPIAFHLVKQASSHSTGIRDVCLSLAEHVPDETSRQRFLETCEQELKLPALSLTQSASKPPSGLQPRPSAPPGQRAWDPQTLERARKALAVYLGPVAKLVVDKAAKRAKSADDLYQMLAGEIASPVERARFLASKQE